MVHRPHRIGLNMQACAAEADAVRTGRITDVNALSKTVVRVNNVAALLRQVRSDRDGLDGASVATKDQYTRYGMAH